MLTPTRLPERLTISLWDFSWYTRTAPGEPFDDLDRAMAEAVQRGYNTVRICAMPYLLFGEHVVDATRLVITAVAPGVGHGTRWYDVAGGETLDGRAHLLDLFRAAKRHGVHVIVSSWEYQQSPAFSQTSDWYDCLAAVDPETRFDVLADCLARLVSFLADHGLDQQIAYLELHNEIDLSRLTKVVPPGEDPYRWTTAYNARAVERLRASCPEHLVTTCYGITPHLDMGAVPDNLDVAHFHVYVYGVLAALERWAGVRVPPPEFPRPELLALQRRDAPLFEEYQDRIEPWRLEATGISPSMLYSHDTIDPDLWDRWLYEHYAVHAEAMRQAIVDRLTAVAAWARRHGVPAVIGEGWIGYTPLRADFEDGPIGKAVSELAVETARELEFWGVVLGSNCAPHHPAWADVEWQRAQNARFLA